MNRSRKFPNRFEVQLPIPDHAWNDGNRYRRSSCKSTSCISAGLSADGDGNEHTSLGLLKAGSILSNYSGIFLILVVLLVGLILFLSLSEKGHIYLRNAAYHLPVFRDIPLAADYGRLAQGLSLGLKSGLTPDTSLELSAEMVSHPLILKRLEETGHLLEEGTPFYQALTDSKLLPVWRED